MDKEKTKSITEIIEDAKTEMCDDYWYQFSEDEQDDLYAICETCPLDRL